MYHSQKILAAITTIGFLILTLLGLTLTHWLLTKISSLLLHKPIL